MGIREKLQRMDKIERSGYVNMAVKPFGVLLNLLYTPLLLNYLGDEKYGLWATVLSIVSWINFFDVGIGNGLRNILSKDIVDKKLDDAQRAVSTAYVILSLITMCIFLVLSILVFRLDWKYIFSTNVEMKLVLLISAAFICINFVLALANIMLYALQLSEKVAYRNIAVQLLNILGLYLFNRFSSGNLVYVSFLFGVTQLIVNVLTTVQVLKKHRYLAPRIKFFNRKYLRDICATGAKFFIIQIMCLLMFTVDDMLITHFFGAETNASFSIVNKIYNTGYSIFAAFMVPYWSATTKEYEAGNVTWIKNAIVKSFKVLAIFVVGYFSMIVIFDPICLIWLGKHLEYQSGLIMIMALFYSLYSALNIESQFINGTGLINTQMLMYMVLGISNIPLSIFMGVHCGLGTIGIRGATLILVAIAVIILGFNLYSIINSKCTSGNNMS